MKKEDEATKARAGKDGDVTSAGKRRKEKVTKNSRGPRQTVASDPLAPESESESAHVTPRERLDEMNYPGDPLKDPLVLAAYEAAVAAWDTDVWVRRANGIGTLWRNFEKSVSNETFVAPPWVGGNRKIEDALRSSNILRFQDSRTAHEIYAHSMAFYDAQCVFAAVGEDVKRLVDDLRKQQRIDKRPTLPKRTFAFVALYLFKQAECPLPDPDKYHSLIGALAMVMGLASEKDDIWDWKQFCEDIEFDPNEDRKKTRPIESLFLQEYADLIGRKPDGTFRDVTPKEILNAVRNGTLRRPGGDEDQDDVPIYIRRG